MGRAVDKASRSASAGSAVQRTCQVGARCEDRRVPTTSLARVIARRLATQRLTSAGLPRGADVVRLLTCVQAQDAPLAAWSLGMRLRAGASHAGVLDEQAAGGWLRTHVLRPTWHLVAPEDLRWLQRLTGPKVESSMSGRHRGLGLDERTVGRALETLADLLGGPTPLTRREIATAFAARGLPAGGEQMAHQLIVAELRAVICSGPPRGANHTYVLVDEAVPVHPHDALDGADARRELVRRFVRGHGPASERDLARWCALTLGEIRPALADLAPDLGHVEIGEHRLWFDPGGSRRTSRPQRALLLPTFDEASLSYATTGFPRRDPGADRARLVSEAGGGVVVVDGEDAGTWKRTVARSSVRVAVRADVPLENDEVTAVTHAAQSLATFLDLPLDLSIT